MSEWQRVRLGDILSLAYGTALAEDERSGTEYPVFGSNGEVGRHQSALVKGPGIIVGRKGSVGALTWTEESFWPIDTTYWVAPRPNIDLRWLYNAMQHLPLEELNSSTGVPGLNRADVYRQSLLIPPFREQRRIVEILDTTDDVIYTEIRKLHKLRQYRLSLAEELLCMSTEHTQDAVLADFLSSMVDGPFGSKMRSQHYVSSPGVRVVRLANIGDGMFNNTDKVFIPNDYATSLSRHGVRPGDVLVALLGDDNHRPGRACVYPRDIESGVVKADCFRLRPITAILSESYLTNRLNERHMALELRRRARGVTRDRITLTQLRQLPFDVPSLDEQRRVVRILDTFDETIHTQESHIHKARKTRRGLAADLLSGRVRTVTDVESRI